MSNDIEIERKFLVNEKVDLSAAYLLEDIKQSYITVVPAIRIRITNNKD